jgi:3-dehydroquinate synthetase
MQLDLCSNELPERICHTLQKLNLPVSLSGFEPKAVISAMRGDKKRSNGQLQFVLPVSLGKVTLISENQIPVSLLEDVLHTWVWERNKA